MYMCPYNEREQGYVYTVEPSYKGHLGIRHLVLYKEVVLSLEVQNVLSRYEVIHLGPQGIFSLGRGSTCNN